MHFQKRLKFESQNECIINEGIFAEILPKQQQNKPPAAKAKAGNI